MNREAVAFHEAGHAVVCLAHGWSLAFVTIAETELTHGSARMGDFRVADPLTVDDLALIDAAMSWEWAGRVAMERHGQTAPDELNSAARDDLASIARLAMFVSEDDGPAAELHIERIRLETVAMLEDPEIWRAVEAVAAALLVEETITGERATELVAQCRA